MTDTYSSHWLIMNDRTVMRIIAREEKHLDGKMVARVFLMEGIAGGYRVIKWMSKNGHWSAALDLTYRKDQYDDARFAFQSLVNDFSDPDLDHYYRED